MMLPSEKHLFRQHARLHSMVNVFHQGHMLFGFVVEEAFDVLLEMTCDLGEDQ